MLISQPLVLSAAMCSRGCSCTSPALRNHSHHYTKLLIGGGINNVICCHAEYKLSSSVPGLCFHLAEDVVENDFQHYHLGHLRWFTYSIRRPTMKTLCLNCIVRSHSKIYDSLEAAKVHTLTFFIFFWDHCNPLSLFPRLANPHSTHSLMHANSYPMTFL